MAKALSILLSLFLCGILASQVQGGHVFAHFMMGNTYPSNVTTMANNIRVAEAAGIEAFALNTGPDEWMPDRISQMFEAATQFPNFKLFFSFDMAVMPTDPNVLINYVKQYHAHPNSFFYQDRYFVSTFSGESITFGEPTLSDGWQKHFKDPLAQAGINIFFVPAWTSLGPFSFFEKNPVADGAFSWAAWNPANNYKTTDEDVLYIQNARANNKTYMAPASPWFFTHFSYKNFIYKSDALWPIRWQQILNLQPEFVEIISWNDYGESHYVGPIDGALPTGSEVWVEGYDHQAFLDMASYYIAAYKTGTFPTLTTDKVYFWYRTHSKSAQMSDSVPLPNNNDWAEDIIVVHALLASDGQITVTNGGNTVSFDGKEGINTFQVNFQEGDVEVSLVRSGQTVVTRKGDKPIKNSGGLYNFNACINMMESAPTIQQALSKFLPF